MLPYPQIDPVALAIGPLKIHWYGLMYLIGIGGAWLLASRRLNRFDPTWNKEKLSDLVFWLSMGCLLYTSPSPRDQRGSRMPSSA